MAPNNVKILFLVIGCLVLGWLCGYVWRSWLAYNDWRHDRDVMFKLDQLLSRVYLRVVTHGALLKAAAGECYFCGWQNGHAKDCAVPALRDWNDNGRGYINAPR